MLLADFDALATGLLDGNPIAMEGRKIWKFVLMVAKAMPFGPKPNIK